MLDRLQQAVELQNSIAISVVTYYEMLLGRDRQECFAAPRELVEAFVARLSAILPWDRVAAEEATRVRRDLSSKGTPIGGNDAMIAGHALAARCVLVTNNVREFSRVVGLHIEDWATQQ